MHMYYTHEIQTSRTGPGLQGSRNDASSFVQECADLAVDFKQVIQYTESGIWSDRQFKNINLEAVSMQVAFKRMKVGAIMQRKNLGGEENPKQNHRYFTTQIPYKEYLVDDGKIEQLEANYARRKTYLNKNTLNQPEIYLAEKQATYKQDSLIYDNLDITEYVRKEILEYLKQKQEHSRHSVHIRHSINVTPVMRGQCFSHVLWTLDIYCFAGTMSLHLLLIQLLPL